MKVIIRDGMIIDGTGKPPEKGNIVVIDGKIVDMGPDIGLGLSGVDEEIEAEIKKLKADGLTDQEIKKITGGEA